MSAAGPRVAGIDPGTVSFDVCALDGGEVILERSFRTADVGVDPAPLVDALVAHGPFELVLGPAGYGLPLVPGDQVGERELALIVLAQPIATTRPGAKNGNTAADASAPRPGTSLRVTSHAMNRPIESAIAVAASAIQNVVSATDHTR